MEFVQVREGFKKNVPKIKTTSKMKMTSKLKPTSKIKITSKMMTTSKDDHPPPRTSYFGA